MVAGDGVTKWSLVTGTTRSPVGEGGEPARLTAWLHGRVQGVGMRWWVRSRALPLGLDGWARNLPDGRVEVVAEGSRAACQSLLAALAPTPLAEPEHPSAHRRPGQIDTVVERWSGPLGAPPGFTER